MADEINLTNFAPSGNEGELRTIAFGPTGSMKLFLEIDVDESDNVAIDLTVSNACEHSELKEFIGDMVSVLQDIADTLGEKENDD